MGRNSKLTEEQWAELFRRVCEGESRRALGDEFGLSEASIRQREAKIGKTAEVQQVARMIVETQAAYESLPRTGQINAQSLAARLKAISSSLASAAELGAATSHRLAALANSEVNKVDDAKPMESVETLKAVAAMTKLSNEAGAMGLNLLGVSSRGGLAQIDAEEGDSAPQGSGVLVVPGLMADSGAWAKSVQGDGHGK